MAHIKKRGDRWFVEVCIDRKRRARTFGTKREAQAWAAEQEDAGLLARRTLSDAIEAYRPIAEAHKGAQAELSRLNALAVDPVSLIPLEFLTAAKVAEWRDRRLAAGLASVSVRREMIILGAMLEVARREWGWIRTNPVRDVRRPPSSVPRRRGVPADKIERVLAELGRTPAGRQVAQLFVLALETGMRLSEMTGLSWSDVGEKVLVLVDTKNGDRRDVPLSHRAREVLSERRALRGETVFSCTATAASRAFARAVAACGAGDVHFHDSRSEAITRLSKRLDVMQLAKMIGHRDLKSLMIYYAERAEDIADRL